MHLKPFFANMLIFKRYLLFTETFRLRGILTESKEGLELKKVLNPHFGKIFKGLQHSLPILKKFSLNFSSLLFAICVNLYLKLSLFLDGLLRVLFLWYFFYLYE